MAPWNKGKKGIIKHTDEWKNKMRELMKKRYVEGVITTLFRKGSKTEDWTPERRIKVGLKSKNRVVSMETRILHSLHWKPHTEATKKKLSEMFKGERSHFWKGGATKQTQLRVRNYKWDAIKKQAYKRDKWTCQLCRRTKIKLFAHHIIPYRICKNDNLDNLITVCGKCHSKLEVAFNRGEIKNCHEA